MSASLVGSEMCIRDRLSSLGARRLLLGWHTWQNHPARWMRAMCGPGSVSYTHLTLPTICSV
eukprot:1819488-Alexandrium_andersonii.AAC.1